MHNSAYTVVEDKRTICSPLAASSALISTPLLARSSVALRTLEATLAPLWRLDFDALSFLLLLSRSLFLSFLAFPPPPFHEWLPWLWLFALNSMSTPLCWPGASICKGARVKDWVKMPSSSVVLHENTPRTRVTTARRPFAFWRWWEAQ